MLSTSNLGQVGLSPIQAPWGSILSNTWATQKSPCHLTVPLRVQVGRIFSTSYGTDCDLQVCWWISVGRGCPWSYHSAQWPSSHFTDRSHTTELVSLGRSGGPGGSFGPELGGRSGRGCWFLRWTPCWSRSRSSWAAKPCSSVNVNISLTWIKALWKRFPESSPKNSQGSGEQGSVVMKFAQIKS